jgi:hypothetical protein
MGSIAIIEAKTFRSEAERESVALNPTPAAGDSSLAHHTSSYICYRSIVRQCVSMRPRPRDSTFAGEDVSEPCLRVDITKFCGPNQSIHDGGTFSAALGTGEKPRLSS